MTMTPAIQCLFGDPETVLAYNLTQTVRDRRIGATGD